MTLGKKYMFVFIRNCTFALSILAIPTVALAEVDIAEAIAGLEKAQADLAKARQELEIARNELIQAKQDVIKKQEKVSAKAPSKSIGSSITDKLDSLRGNYDPTQEDVEDFEFTTVLRKDSPEFVLGKETGPNIAITAQDDPDLKFFLGIRYMGTAEYSSREPAGGAAADSEWDFYVMIERIRMIEEKTILMLVMLKLPSRRCGVIRF